MKRAIIILGAAALMISGCKQQQAQWGQGQGGQNQVVAPAPAMKSPDEMRQLETLAKSNPDNPKAWIALGNAHMDSQRFADAIVAYQKALELDPKNVDVRVDMGTCYRGVGQPLKAIEEYQKAAKLNPNHPNAYRNTGVVYAYDLNRRPEAIKAFRKYLEVLPNAPDAAQIQGEIQRLSEGK